MSTATTHIKTDKQLVPALRFKEFDNDWETSKFGAVNEVLDSLHQTPKEYVEEGFAMIRVTDVNDGDLNIDECLKVSEEVFIEFTKRHTPTKDDIIMSRVGTCGAAIKLNSDEPVCLGQNTVLLIPSIEKSFVFTFMRSRFFQNQVDRMVVGSTQKTLSLRDLKKFNFSIPSLPEQQKIATFLSAVDEKIQQLTKKKELLEQYKKGVMQQLFSYEKRLKKGELRKGNLGDFGFFYYGKGAPKTSVVKGAPTPCVRYGELYSTFKEEIKEIKSYTIVDPKELKLSKGGEVLVPRVGEKPLEFANCSYLPFPNVAIGEMISVYNTEEDGLFMTYYINARLQKQLARMVEGANVSNLYFRYVAKIEVEIPSLEEQKLIIKFVSSIDTKIESVNNQITQTQTFKKGLLQQMFVAA